MKMQNAEMEFVAFDAQDVITTSGPVPTFSYFSGNQLKDAQGNYFNNTNVSWFVGTDRAINKAGSTINEGAWSYNEQANFANYYLITSAQYHKDTSAYTINATGYESAPGGDYLETLDEIFAYLSSITQ